MLGQSAGRPCGGHGSWLDSTRCRGYSPPLAGWAGPTQHQQMAPARGKASGGLGGGVGGCGGSDGGGGWAETVLVRIHEAVRLADDAKGQLHSWQPVTVSQLAKVRLGRADAIGEIGPPEAIQSAVEVEESHANKFSNCGRNSQ